LVHYKVPEDDEITICGDIHGQYYDLLNIFKTNGNPSPRNEYIFNGDFVDRGSFSVECILTLMAWKCVGLHHLHMTRGNHEAKQVNMIYGFKGEVEAKYKDIGVYEAFSEFFCTLPLAYVLNNRVMVCHGGLPSVDGVTLPELQKINRFIEPPDKGNMCDLLWADPVPGTGRKPSKRGVSMHFGEDISHRFLDENKLGMSSLT
jgi:serine/threonine-protein phosphatase 5